MDQSRDAHPSLTAALRAVAKADEHLDVPPAVEARLFAEVEAIARRRRHQRLAFVAAAAAVLALAAGLPVWRSAERAQPGVAVESGEGAVENATREEATAFFPLTYSNVPAAGGHLVRLPVERAVLASFGVTEMGNTGDAGPTVLADVVVGDDGLARAVRFVRVVYDTESQEQEP